MTNYEAREQQACLICKGPGARLFRLKDGRLFSGCDACLRTDDFGTFRGAVAVPWSEWWFKGERPALTPPTSGGEP